jgi:Protein phosphatase 2C
MPAKCFASINTFLIQKRGSEVIDCEDVFSANEGRKRFCIADGATEGFASRYWARLIVKHWTRSNELIIAREQLMKWSAALGLRFERRWQRRPLPWFAEEKARSGGYAAFVGLSFRESGHECYWKAIAIGDACLIIRNKDVIRISFPLDDPEKFRFRPVLLPSNQCAQQTVLDKIEVRSGLVEPGDSFFLLTDAVAAWFLHVAKSTPGEITKLEQMLRCRNRNELTEFIECARSNGSLRNDDVCIVRVAP